jgi:hypothetical protein
MSEGLPWFRKVQKKAIAATDVAAGKTAGALDAATGVLKKLDAEFDITAKARAAGERIEAAAHKADAEYNISGKAHHAKRVIAYAAEQTKDAALRAADDTGLTERAEAAAEAFKARVRDPVAEAMEKHGINEAIRAVGRRAESAYGQARSVIKPYFGPESGRELLLNTKRELTYISACVMQISPSDAEKVAAQFGTAVASKIAGLATTGALLALVSSFGTAGTGTAIASLSGAAAANATSPGSAGWSVAAWRPARCSPAD